MATGVLNGLKVLEFDAIGPVPFCATLLANMGAEVVRVQQPGLEDEVLDPLRQGRRHFVLDLKADGSTNLCLDLIRHADVLIEGFRPGVMERLGLAPDHAFERNAALVYGRLTGWGQDGPLAHTAGHDINYLALTGALHMIGAADKPTVPLNLVGDYGGGAMFMLSGILGALLHAAKTGEGQVVDVAMVDGVATLLTGFYDARARGLWLDARSRNVLDGGAPFYDTYRCRDGKWIAFGAIEARFFDIFLERAGAPSDWAADAADPARWPDLRERLGTLFRRRDRDAWQALFEGTDACVTPILSMEEAPTHPHNVARQAFFERAGVQRPSTAPRFSRTPGGTVAGGAGPCDPTTLLKQWANRVD